MRVVERAGHLGEVEGAVADPHQDCGRCPAVSHTPYGNVAIPYADWASSPSASSIQLIARPLRGRRRAADRVDSGRATGSSTPQQPNETNAAADGLDVLRRPRRDLVGEDGAVADGSRIAATSCSPAPPSAACTATIRLRKPWCSKPVCSSRNRTAWCRPAVNFIGAPSRTASTTTAATVASVGNASAVVPPVRNLPT